MSCSCRIIHRSWVSCRSTSHRRTPASGYRATRSASSAPTRPTTYAIDFNSITINVAYSISSRHIISRCTLSISRCAITRGPLCVALASCMPSTKPYVVLLVVVVGRSPAWFVRSFVHSWMLQTISRRRVAAWQVLRPSDTRIPTQAALHRQAHTRSRSPSIARDLPLDARAEHDLAQLLDLAAVLRVQAPCTHVASRCRGPACASAYPSCSSMLIIDAAAVDSHPWRAQVEGLDATAGPRLGPHRGSRHLEDPHAQWHRGSIGRTACRTRTLARNSAQSAREMCCICRRS